MSEISKPILQQLKRTFDIIIKFCKLQENLYTVVLRDAQNRKMKQQQMRKRTAQGNWGSTTADEDQSKPLADVSEIMLTKLNEVSIDYSNQFESLLNMLVTERSENECLRYLTFRLNFNEFYSEATKLPE